MTATHQGKSWQIGIEDQALVARDPRGQEAWRIGQRFAAVVGIVPGLPYEVPMVRVAHLNGVSGRGFLELLDIDATGSQRGQAAFPVRGISVLGHGMNADGLTAIAIRLDASIQRDYVMAYDQRGTHMWAWQLPERPRPDPVGVWVEPARVVVFLDTDRVVVLPIAKRVE